MKSRCMSGGARSKKSWVSKAEKKIKNKGSFSRAAAAKGLSTQAFACDVLRSKSKYDARTRRRAQFYVNINKSHRC